MKSKGNSNGNSSASKQLQSNEQQQQLEAIGRQSAVRILCPILLFLLFDHLYLNTTVNQQQQLARKVSGGSDVAPFNLSPPSPLLNYAEFKEKYPRNDNLWATPELESCSRELLFVNDLLRLGKHNLRYILQRETYSVKQSYFTADRTISEQVDTLWQLDQLNLTKIWSRNAEALDGLDNQVSGINRLTSRLAPDHHDKADVELANPLERWWMRKTKGQSHFEIPNFPLDEQPNPDLITHIDADLRACTDDIQDQKDCGACYAFTWNSFAQWHYCRQTGGTEQVDFSEQHIVDCGYVARLAGCISGLLPDVREFSHTFGFHLEKDYPYKAKQQACKKQMGSIAVKTIDFKRIIVDRQEWEEVLKEQPILVEVHLPSDIMSYNRGVHPGNNCDSQLAHGMLLVGHGRQAGVPYWLLKNSMGKGWGENGYLRLSRDMSNMNQCFQTGFISKFKYQQLDEEKFYAFYDSLKFEPTTKQVAKKTTA